MRSKNNARCYIIFALIYSVNIVDSGKGISIIDVDCSGLYEDKVDLYSSLIVALGYYATEAFSGVMQEIDLGSWLLSIVPKENYFLLLISDKNKKENDKILRDLHNLLDQEYESIQDALEYSYEVGYASGIKAKILRIFMNFGKKYTNPTLLKALAEKVEKMVQAKRWKNLAMKKHLLETRITLGKILRQNVSIHKKELKSTLKEMRNKKKEVCFHLQRMKNLLYNEYLGSKSMYDISWAKLYTEMRGFYLQIQYLTRKDIITKYIEMARTVLDNMRDRAEDLQYVVDEILQMDDNIDGYVSF